MQQLWMWRASSMVLVSAALIVACGRGSQVGEIPLAGPGADIVPPRESVPAPAPVDEPPHSAVVNPGAKDGMTRIVLTEAMIIRNVEDGVLETLVTMPKGTTLDIPSDYEIVSLNYRKPDGSVVWSSTGFIGAAEIVAVPTAQQSQFPDDAIEDYNQTAGGLYISAAVVGNVQGVTGNFPALTASPLGDDFLKSYQATGQPKFNYAAKLSGRFGDKVNKGIDPNKLSQSARVKWRRIYAELKRAADRTVETPKALLMIDKALADKHSIAYEKSGVVPLNGAWTIAVQSTSVRHGFGNVPCAEFMSEILREAYQRAGYSASDDFNDKLKNRLIWSETAAVVNLSKALYLAGWVPWNTALYRPPTGAMLMNAWGNTPGHAYISAGDDGRFIVDNGSPQGRDLRKTTHKIINMMYMTGLFFLPPGVNPSPW